MRALVTGASGLVGGRLCEMLDALGHRVWGTTHSQKRLDLLPLDIRDRGAVERLVPALRPEVIFHAAAEPNVEWCEAHPVDGAAVNVAGLANLLTAASRVGSKVVFFSSEYVFDGRDGPYSELAPPRPISVYGRQKVAGERLMGRFQPGGLILRTTVVFGWERAGKNFVARLLGELGAGREMRVPNDQISSPTYVDDLVRAACELAERDAHGLYHVAGTERADRYALAVAAAREFGLDSDRVVGVPTAELGQLARRPLRGGLDVERLRQTLGWAPDGFRAALRRMREERPTWYRT